MRSPGPVTGEMTTVYSFLVVQIFPALCSASSHKVKVNIHQLQNTSSLTFPLKSQFICIGQLGRKQEISQGKKMCNVHRASDFSL